MTAPTTAAAAPTATMTSINTTPTVPHRTDFGQLADNLARIVLSLFPVPSAGTELLADCAHE